MSTIPEPARWAWPSAEPGLHGSGGLSATGGPTAQRCLAIRSTTWATALVLVPRGTSWLAARGRDERYSYGYDRYRMLGGWAAALVLIVGRRSCWWWARTASGIPEPVDATGMLWLAVFGVVMNGLAAGFFIGAQPERTGGVPAPAGGRARLGGRADAHW